jgi:hypothetical protein
MGDKLPSGDRCYFGVSATRQFSLVHLRTQYENIPPVCYFTPPSHQIISVFLQTFFVCLLTSLSSFCNRHLWYPTYIHVVCLVKKKLIEKITKRFKRWKSQQVWFSLCTVSTNLFFFVFISRETHTVCFFDCMYMYTCVSTTAEELILSCFSFAFISLVRIYERERRKKNWEKSFENNWMMINNNNCTCHGCHNICLYFKLVFSIYIIYRLLKRVYCIYIYGVNKIERYYPRKNKNKIKQTGNEFCFSFLKAEQQLDYKQRRWLIYIFVIIIIFLFSVFF